MEVDIKENYIIDSGTDNEYITSKGEKLDSGDLQIQSLNSNENLKVKTPVYILTVELEDGRSEHIHIFSDSDPSKLAYDFCSDNKLEYNALVYLSQEIAKLITKYGGNNPEFKESKEMEFKDIRDEKITEVDEEQLTESKKGGTVGTLSRETLSKEIASVENEFYSLNIEHTDSIKENFAILEREINTFTQREQDNFIKGKQKSLQNSHVYSKQTKSSQQMPPKNSDSAKGISAKSISYQVEKYKKFVNKSKYPNKNGPPIPPSTILAKQEKYKKNSDNTVTTSNKPSNRPLSSSRNGNNGCSISNANPINNGIFERLYNQAKLKKEKFEKFAAECNQNENTKPRYARPNANLYEVSQLNSNQITSSMKVSTNKLGEVATHLTKCSSSKNLGLVNFGERLYNKGMKMKEKSLKLIESAKLKKEESEIKECTFSPKFVNKAYFNYDLLFRDRSNTFGFDSPKFKQHKEEVLSKIKEKYVEEVFDFSPRIDAKSRLIAESKYSGEGDESRRHLLLYEKARNKGNRLQELSNRIYNNYENLFRPTINHDKSPSKGFFERLEADRVKIEERRRFVEFQWVHPVDFNTGEYLFSPKLIAKRSKSAERLSTNFGDYLYSFANKYQKKRNEKLNEVEEEIKMSQHMSHVSETTNKILTKMKNESFRQIFRLLDSDEDNLINKITMDLRRLPRRVLNILEPLLYEVREKNLTRNESEFTSDLETLFKSLSHDAQTQLMSMKNIHANSSSFHNRSSTCDFNIYELNSSRSVRNNNSLIGQTLVSSVIVPNTNNRNTSYVSSQR